MEETLIQKKLSTVCVAGISRKQLRDFLFREKAEMEVDERIREHAQDGACSACTRRIVELKISEGYLRGDEIEPTGNIEIIDEPETNDEEILTQEALIAEVSRKLAGALASPAQKPFDLNDLFQMSSKLITVSNAERKKMIAREVAQACDKRWRRLHDNGKDKIEAAASRLMTLILAVTPPEPEPVTPETLGLHEYIDICKFLQYMMTKDWFLNPDCGSTWDYTQGTKAEEIKAGKAKIEFHVDVLRQALLNWGEGKTEDLGRVLV